MRLMTAAAFLLATTIASQAQPAPPLPTEYTITVTGDDLNLIGRGIEELPAKIANPLTQRLLAQINAQNEAWKKAHQPPAPIDPNGNPVPLPTPKP